MSVLNCSLDLIYPPISNQEGTWLWEDNEVREYVKNSKLYMLVHRKELKFVNIDYNLIRNGIFKFKISMGNFISAYFSFEFLDYILKSIDADASVLIEEGDKFIRITRESDNAILYWATPDKILYDVIKGNIELKSDNISDIHTLQHFELLYVGISKKNDSFTRLFENAHHGRLNILSNEYTKEKTARMTDELMILLFEIKWFNINTVTQIENMNDLFTYTDDEEAIVADAEKAFVSMLDSRYNEIKYKEYPKSTDGLYNKGLKGYAYSINYDLTLFTDKYEFHGKYDNLLERDSILVHENNVLIVEGNNP